MDDKLIQICNEMNKKDQESFNILEQNILLYGLQGFIDKDNDLYLNHIGIIRDRNPYNDRTIKEYITALDLIYKLRSSFLNHMTNQNIISVCKKDMIEKQIKIDMLNKQIEKFL